MRSFLSLVMALALTAGIAAAQAYPTSNPDQQNQQTYPQANQQQTYPQNQQQYPQANEQSYPSQQATSANSANEIAAGTEVQIRTNENIDANKETVGRQYSAEIAQDVMGSNGQVLIPKGSPATLAVQNVSSGTLGVQSNEVALALQSVTINGQKHDITANTVQQSGNRGIGANRRTAEMTGGGALLGTLIGAMAGGGKGAAIGAAVGAAGGAATQVLTRGSEVKVPAETLLTFKLDQPISLQ